MTTQVVLLNSHGLAFATDSATTFGNGTVYNDANKVSILPHRHKVAVLHAGMVGMHNVTHLQLIEQWMFDLGEDPLPSIAAYFSNYLEWLSTKGKTFVSDESAESTVLSVLRASLGAIADEMRNLINEPPTNDPTSEDVATACLSKIEQGIKALDEFPEPVGFSPIWADKVLRKIAQRLDETVFAVFEGIPKAPGFGDAVREFAYMVLARSPYTTPATLTFAGYGQEEFAPSVVQLMVGILHENTLLYRRGDDIHFVRDRAPHLGIVVVGHESTIDLVLQGYNETTVDAAVDAVTGAYGGAPRNVSAIFEEKCWLKRADQVLPTLAGIPVPMLAFIASQFVGLEALEKVLTASNPTVGGEIKTWTITKAAGCVPFQGRGG